jgi:serine/threonine-protein kinase
VTETGGASAFVGRTFDDRYRVDGLLGEGGMGAVFVAHHLRLDKPVALKVILPEHAGNTELASRFAREAMLTAKIDHPHVVSAIDTGELPGGGAYLVMQLAKGRSLREFVVPGSGWTLACEIGAQIADALAAAHAMGIVHRDLKPENVMVEERDGQVHCRVLDFGIARATESTTGATGATGNLTRVGTVLGTPGYMPPEQALGETVDARADLYALGVIVWEVAAGRMLFPADDPRATALAQLTEPVPSLPQSDVPPALVDLLDALLQPKKEARPGTAIEVRDRLRQLRASAIVSTPPAATPPLAPASDPALATTASAGAAAMGAVPSPAPPVPRTRVSDPDGRTRAPTRWVLALAVSVLVVLVTCCGMLALDPLGCRGGDLADVPSALRADATTLIHDPDAMARSIAASRLAPERASLPPFLQHLDDLELAPTCEARRDAVRALTSDADPRALPAIERWRALPTQGCGADGHDDCHACMRADLDDAARALGGGDAPRSPPPPPTSRTSDDDGPATKTPSHRPAHGRHHGR